MPGTPGQGENRNRPGECCRCPHWLLFLPAVPAPMASLLRFCTFILGAKTNPSSCFLSGGDKYRCCQAPATFCFLVNLMWAAGTLCTAVDGCALGREVGVSHQVHLIPRSYSAQYMEDIIPSTSLLSASPLAFVS